MENSNKDNKTDPPNEKKLKLPHKDWKEAFGEFIKKEDQKSEANADEDEKEE